jgi:hypothetical protein
MHDATRQNMPLSPRSIWWLYSVLLVVGLAYGVVFILIAFDTWSEYLHPPTYDGFGPFLLNSPYFVAKDSARAIAEFLLIGAVIALFLSKRRVSAHLALVSVVVVITCVALDVTEAVRGFRENWLYAIAWVVAVDAAWTVLMVVAAVALLRLSPNNSFKPTPLRGAA